MFWPGLGGSRISAIFHSNVQSTFFSLYSRFEARFSPFTTRSHLLILLPTFNRTALVTCDLYSSGNCDGLSFADGQTASGCYRDADAPWTSDGLGYWCTGGQYPAGTEDTRNHLHWSRWGKLHFPHLWWSKLWAFLVLYSILECPNPFVVFL